MLRFFSPRLRQQQQQKLMLCLPISSPASTKDFLKFCPASPKHSSLSRYCFSAPLICSGEADHLHETLRVSGSSQAGKRRPYFHLAVEGFLYTLPRHGVSPGEAAVDVSRSKTKGHNCKLPLPRESFFFFKGMKAQLPYSLASFAKQTRANDFHSLTLFFPSKETSPASREDPFEACCTLST